MRRLLVAAMLAAVTLVVTSCTSPTTPQAAPLSAADFIKASGSVLKTDSGSGSTINLRGTNVGGWLAHEEWMSPLGEFAVDRTGWSAAASSGTASRAIDGSRSARWTTNANQGGAEWLRLDLGANTVFNRLSIDNSNTPGQYPRNVTVETSMNGTTWVSVANQAGIDGVTTVRFSPQVARYVRVNQTATAAAPWSVGEINLFFDPVHRNTGFTAAASATAGGATASSALDDNLSTAWQSGAPQVPGQSFTVDFGRNVDMDRVLFDAGAATASDYPRSWEVLTSWDNVTFTPVASGYGKNRVIQADFNGWKNARYLRIINQGTAPQWWSIAEIAVSNGNNLNLHGRVVTASAGSSPGNILDGSPATRWTTGAPQVPGQWIQVDLGALVTLNTVWMDTAKNTADEGDFPRGYRLELSRNGSTWKTVATGIGTPKATNISFGAQAARYFRLTQTGTAPQWWSIGELSAGLYNDDYSLNNTLTSRFGTTGAQTVLDAHQDAWLTEADIDNIQAAGLNLIRVPIGWNTFLNLDGSWKSNPWEKLDWLIDEASQRGIYVLLDLHMLPGGACSWGSCGRYGPYPNEFWLNDTYQDWTVDIWEAMATRYKGVPGVAGYDLINEPLIDPSEDADDLKKKNDFYDRLYDAVRAIDPDHLIVLGAFLGMDAVAHPSTYGWTNVMYQLHPYDMGSPTDWTAQDRLVTNELSALPARLTDPGVPLLNGEYSLYYNDDVWARFMAGMNASNVSWSNWTYKVKGAADQFAYWGMYNDNPRPIPIINSDDSATFIAKVGQFVTSNFTKNTRFVETIKKYAGGLSTFAPVPIGHEGWSATASATSFDSSAAAGIDGANSAAWYSGRSQAGGEWYQIDMGAIHTVAMVTVQTPPDARWDYPRGFIVETSTDGTTWASAAKGVAYGWKRPISIAPTTARYIRMTQTGTAPQWWSIDEVTVYSSY
ncbi:discoidin domain-containing protein [Microbacterium sp. DT81.1]|uniref:discoidin domain-containing protein n=1 Tax=Microbacterium sp. DT81.1 TaxID=3393413 RepID=UPI003CE9F173